MRLYFTGSEVTAHRDLLHQQGVRNMALSFTGVRKRPKMLANLSEVFPADVSIFVESGAYSLNKDEDKFTPTQLENMAGEYAEYIQNNIERIDMFSEFDSAAMGPAWIQDMREQHWLSKYPIEKFLPVWHPEDGIKALERLAGEYPRVGISAMALEGRNLAPMLNGIARTGVKLHTMTTKPDELREVKWDSAASTSWLSPSQFGDTIVWTGKELKRYPKKYKDQARRRHRTLFTNNGFDAGKIENDDNDELLKVSIWSWLRLEEDIVRHEVTTTSKDVVLVNAQNDVDLVDTTHEEVPNPEPRRSKQRDATVVIPVLGIRTESDDEGEEFTTPYMRSESTRICDSCFLASKCEAYEPGYNCAYNIPVQIRTRDDYRRLYDSLIEMQAQRVIFMRLAEEAEGGYADPNLSQEISRLDKLIQSRHEMDQEGFTLNVTARAQGQAGMISRLFGSDAGQQVMALPKVIEADSAIRMIEGT